MMLCLVREHKSTIISKNRSEGFTQWRISAPGRDGMGGGQDLRVVGVGVVIEHSHHRSIRRQE